MEMPFTNPRRPVSVSVENVTDTDCIVSGFDEIDEMSGRLWVSPGD